MAEDVNEGSRAGAEGAPRRSRTTGARPAPPVSRRGGSGAVIGLGPSARDVGERIRPQQSLANAASYARSLIEASLDPLVTISPDGKITDVNEAAVKATGVSRSELIGTDFSDYFTEPERARSGYLKAFAEGEVRDYPLTLRHRDGRLIEVLYNASVYRDADGSVRGVFAAARDVTAQRRLEADLRAARDLAEEASRAKSEFLSRVSHELRTPLASTIGFADLLLLTELTDQQRHYARTVLKAGDHLLALVNDILDIARIEAGRLSLSPEPSGVLSTLSEVLQLIRPMLAEHDVSVTVAGIPARLSVIADQQRFTQVLLNIVTNAVKYNRRGGWVRITSTANGTRTRVSVQDSGIGLRRDELSRLFSPFDRLSAAASGVEGTGLGLALCKSLLDAMGGRIGAESQEGIGSSFWVELPTALGAEADDAPGAGADERVDAQPEPRGTLLYVEDNLYNVQVLEGVVAQRPGIRLIPAMQGTLALELARQHRPALILLDVHLPDIDGAEFVHRLMADPTTDRIPVVVLSADATVRQMERLLAAGAREYLTKPIRVGVLLEVLDRYLAPEPA